MSGDQQGMTGLEISTVEIEKRPDNEGVDLFLDGKVINYRWGLVLIQPGKPMQVLQLSLGRIPGLDLD